MWTRDQFRANQALDRFLQGVRPSVIAEELHISVATARRWINDQLTELNKDDHANRARQLQAAIESQRAILAAAWEGYHHEHKLDVQPIPHAEANEPTRVTRAPAYLRLAFAAQREIARLQGLYIPQNDSESPEVHIIITRSEPGPENQPPIEHTTYYDRNGAHDTPPWPLLNAPTDPADADDADNTDDADNADNADNANTHDDTDDPDAPDDPDNPDDLANSDNPNAPAKSAQTAQLSPSDPISPRAFPSEGKVAEGRMGSSPARYNAQDMPSGRRMSTPGDGAERIETSDGDGSDPTTERGLLPARRTPDRRGTHVAR